MCLQQFDTQDADKHSTKTQNRKDVNATNTATRYWQQTHRQTGIKTVTVLKMLTF